MGLKDVGFFDRLVETCPMRLTSNNAPEVRDLIATVMVSMINGATRFRHFDRLHGDEVLDLYGGSGTTLIAAERSGRKCRMMELGPKYATVILDRWEAETGKKAELISSRGDAEGVQGTEQEAGQ